MSDCIDKGLGKLLHAYELHALSEQDVERFEMHLMHCEYCFSRVAEFSEYAEAIRSGESVKEAVGRTSEESSLNIIWQYLWPRVPFPFKPGVVYVLLLLLVAPAYYGFKYLSAKNESLRPVQVIRLMANRNATDNTLRIGSGLDGIISFGYPAIVAGKSYQIVITADGGAEIARYDNFNNFNEFGMGELIVPLAEMKKMGAGNYRLLLTDPNADSLPKTVEHRFRIVE